jgi:hypothetical protein
MTDAQARYTKQAEHREGRASYQLGLILPFVLELEILLNKQEQRENNRRDSHSPTKINPT